MSLSELEPILAGSDAAPILSLDEKKLSDPGFLGPAGFYYLALWLESRPSPGGAESEALARRLLGLAVGRGSGIVKKRAAYELMERLEAERLYAELLKLTEDLGSAMAADWPTRRSRLIALDALGKRGEAREEILKLRLDFPREAEAEADALDCIEAAAILSGGSSSAASMPGAVARASEALRRVLLERPASAWTARALSLASVPTDAAAPSNAAAESGAAAPILSEDEARAAAMRAFAYKKDYARAYAEAAAASDGALAGSAPMVSDAGKSYLYSKMPSEGAARFAVVEEAARAAGERYAAWTALFYRGRFARDLGRWDEAAELFARAASGSKGAGASAADADAALWYAAECSGEAADAEASAAVAKAKARPGSPAALRAETRSRSAALDALIGASRAWSGPGDFMDLADELLRKALRARDFGLIERMASELAPRLTPTMRARAAYVASRAAELGLYRPSAGATAPRQALAAIASDLSAPLYYRALASWRSGEAVSFAPSLSVPADGGKPGELESFVSAFADFGLGSLAASEARSALGDLEPGALRRLAARLADKGQHDYSIRVAGLLLEKEGYEAAREDWLLLYPRPYLRQLREASGDERMSERFLLGLVRSESAFRADVESSAGAVGLAQLMSATAAERAASLKMKDYDLRSPGDNLRLGFAHMTWLLDRTDSLLGSIMAYNAGLSRLRSWAAEGAGLPDDLLVESITIAETRQYCRNILQAAAVYGELYEGVPPGVTAGKIVEGK